MLERTVRDVAQTSFFKGRVCPTIYLDHKELNVTLQFF